MPHETPVLLIGGTRGTGRLIASLLARDAVPVRILARNPDRAARALGRDMDIVRGDITKLESLRPAIAGARHIIFTAGCRSGRPVSERTIRSTEYDGVLNTLAVTREAGFAGRFLYMTASGVGTKSFWARALNIYKGKTLEWRFRAEAAIRTSALPYTIIRTGVLTNQRGGRHAIVLTQKPLPLSPRHRIARADVAEAFVAALTHPRTARATFEIFARTGTPPSHWPALFDAVLPDDGSPDHNRG